MADKEKTFKEIHGKTKLGMWLKKNGKPLLNTVLGVAGNLVPGGSAFSSVISGLINNDESLSPEDKEHALKLLEFDIIEQQEVTKRWESDSHSDSWLSKNIRPMVLGYLILCTSILVVLDSSVEGFVVQAHWVTLLSSLLITTVGAYFGLREFGKYASKKFK
jgi:hypothetical protein